MWGLLLVLSVVAAPMEMDVRLAREEGVPALDCRGTVQAGGASVAFRLTPRADHLGARVPLERTWTGYVEVACDGVTAPARGRVWFWDREAPRLDLRAEAAPDGTLRIVRPPAGTDLGRRSWSEWAWKGAAVAWGVVLLVAAGFLGRRGQGST